MGAQRPTAFFIKSEGCERVQVKTTWEKAREVAYEQVQQRKSLKRNTEKKRVLDDRRRHTEYPKLFYKLGYDALRKIKPC